MSAAEEQRDYEEAQRRIAKVIETGGIGLDLSKLENLTTLPPEISNCTALELLFLNNTKVSELAPISNCTALKRLDLNNTKVSELVPISKCTALELLGLRNTEVSELAPISNCTALKRLDLSDTKVSELAPLSNCTALEQLYLINTKVSELAPLSNCTALEQLYLINTKVSELAPLSNCTALEHIHLTNTKVSELAPLSNCTALKRLDLNNTKVSDLRPIRGFENLDGKIFMGLTFKNTPFANASEETRRLAGIEVNEERIRETLAFLNTLPAPPAPLPWEDRPAEVHTTEQAPDDSTTAHQTHKTQIDRLITHSKVTKLSAQNFAFQIEEILHNVPATCGNQMTPPLETMKSISIEMHRLGADPAERLKRKELEAQVAKLEALVKTLQKQLADKDQQLETEKALKKGTFFQSVKQGAGQLVGQTMVTVALSSIVLLGTNFLGQDNPTVQACNDTLEYLIEL